MTLSIITPHYNEYQGLVRIYDCLLKQTNDAWEWIIVDDFSESIMLNNVKKWYEKINDNRVKLICNSTKTNGSVCRNKGAESSQNELLVFLDADDYITNDFVENRRVEVNEFTVFKNIAVDDKYEGIIPLPKKTGNYLDYFLKTQFIWLVTSIVWDRHYFYKIGGFNPKLKRLQDVELSIRALQKSSKYTVLDNTIDFYYRVKPIRERKSFVKPVCDSVYLFITELLDVSNLTTHQLSLLSNYYYFCIKYLERSESFEDVDLVRRNLTLFYDKRYINIWSYFIGAMILKLYVSKYLSSQLFLRINRYLFKSQ
ncbi:glycosyltransferase family 2 protein [Psychroserpens sp. MEBiC05023]